MAKNKYLLLVSSIGVLLLLITAAVQENWLKSWRQLQSTGQTDAGGIPVQLRQITNVNLRVGDRCVTCHVAMAPGEKNVQGAALFTPHKPVVHDPTEYGCTLCHGGQGSATEKEDAHGDVSFWPEPMLPAKFSQAGCGSCHAPLHAPNRDGFEQARLTFERLDCRACHRVDNRGGTIRPGGGGMEGPDLSRVGITGYDRDWYTKHVVKAGTEQNLAWKNSFAKIDARDRETVEVYLGTRIAAPEWIEAKAAFHSYGCLGCHRVSGVGGDEGPDLTRAGLKDPGQADFTHVTEGGEEGGLDTWFAEHFRSPGAVVATSQMPPVTASEKDIDLLTFYVLSLRRRDVPGSYTPKDRMQATRFGQREFAADGATLFSAFCSGCHGLEGKGKHAPGGTTFPAIANPDFLAAVTDEFLTATIARGRSGRRMPGWAKDGGLHEDEIAAIVAHLRELGGGVKPALETGLKLAGNPELGRAVFAANCSGCHGPKGEGAKGPALNNRDLLENVSDRYLAETIARGRKDTAMTGFETPSPTRRALAKEEIESVVAHIRTWQGGKK